MKRKTKKRLKLVVVWFMLIAMVLSLFSGLIPQKESTTITDPKLLEELTKAQEEMEKEEPVPNMEGYYRIEKIRDGTSLSVLWGDEERTVKLIGVSVPEGMEKKAKQFLSDTLSTVDLIGLEFDVKGEDEEGNLLAYVYHPEDKTATVNSLLIREGYAKLAEEKENVKYIEDLRSAENAAKENKAGCWADSKTEG